MPLEVYSVILSLGSKLYAIPWWELFYGMSVISEFMQTISKHYLIVDETN